jgi:hypothetical protein
VKVGTFIFLFLLTKRYGARRDVPEDSFHRVGYEHHGRRLSALVHLRGLMSLQWPYPVCFANLIPRVYLMILRRRGHERGGGDSRETFILESVPAVLDVYSRRGA